MGTTFSKRHGFRKRVDITVREDAPEALRAGLLHILHDEMDLTYGVVREVICPVLHVFPDSNNWSEVPNVRAEVTRLLRDCEWSSVYDICEAVHSYLSQWDREKEFSVHLNGLFEDHGIGWRMVKGEIKVRGPEAFERAVAKATARVRKAGYETPEIELEEAQRDLSRRPKPDITGVIQHCMAALECTARIVAGDEKATLGELVKRRAAEMGIPRPLDNAIEKMWGYASETARHGRESRKPNREEAELLLSLSASLIAYIIEKHRRS